MWLVMNTPRINTSKTHILFTCCPKTTYYEDVLTSFFNYQHVQQQQLWSYAFTNDYTYVSLQAHEIWTTCPMSMKLDLCH